MSRKMTAHALIIGLVATVATTSSQAAITYLSTNFDEADVSGPFTLSTSANVTGLLNTGDATANVTIEENLTTVAVDVQPTGQHLRIDGNLNKHATMENAMKLLTDGVSSFFVSFSYLLTGDINNNEGRIIYSSLGDFSDAVEIRTYVVTGSTRVNGSDLSQTAVAENTWNQASFSVTSSNVTFSDTAKIRFAQDGSGSISSGFYMDDIVISAIPEPCSMSLLALGGLAILRRRR